MCSSTEDFEGRGQVFVEIWRGRSWPREYHIDANSIRLRQVIDVLTCGQHYIYIYSCSSTKDFEGSGQVFVKIHWGPRENHINANHVGQEQVIDICLPELYIRYICTAPPKILKVGGRYVFVKICQGWGESHKCKSRQTGTSD